MSNDTEPTIAQTLVGLTIAPQVEVYVTRLNHVAVQYAQKHGYSFVDKFTVQRLAKFIKVVSTTLYVETGQTSNTHVHAFIDPTTGAVLKPAGWKAPAKGQRFNLLDDASFERLLAVCDVHGSYLYLR